MPRGDLAVFLDGPVLSAGQKRTNAGGRAFQIGPIQQFQRFLYLGAKATLYKSQHQNTAEIGFLMKKIVEDNLLEEAVQMLVESDNVARYDNVTDTLAFLVHSARNEDERRLVLSKMNQICRIPTHLFSFLETYKALRKQDRKGGKGICKIMKAVIGQRYSGNAVSVAMTSLKYKNRNGWQHEDILRLVHKKADTCGMALFFKYLFKGFKEYNAIVEKISPTYNVEKISPTLTSIADVHEDMVESRMIRISDLQSKTKKNLREIAENENVDPAVIEMFGDGDISTTCFIFKIQAQVIKVDCCEAKTQNLAPMDDLHAMTKRELRQFSKKLVQTEHVIQQYEKFGDDELTHDEFVGHIYMAIYKQCCAKESAAYNSSGKESESILSPRIDALLQEIVATTSVNESGSSAAASVDASVVSSVESSVDASASNVTETEPSKKVRVELALTLPYDEGAAKLVNFLNKYHSLSKMSASRYTEAVEIIREFGLSQMHLPTEMLKSPEIWKALLDNRSFGLQAIIRNLPKLTNLQMISADILDRLCDTKQLHNQKINPLKVLDALCTYQRGAGKGKQTWRPDPRVIAALDKCFYESFHHGVEPTNKRFLIGLDVSGSMGMQMNDMSMSCAQAAAALVMMIVRSEQDTRTMAFSNGLIELDIKKTDTLPIVLQKTGGMPFSSTRIDVPIKEAIRRRIAVDVFVIVTDNDCGHGEDPHKVLAEYQRVMNIQAKLLVIGMVSNDFTIAEPGNPDMMDMVGFHPGSPEILQMFAKGTI